MKFLAKVVFPLPISPKSKIKSDFEVLSAIFLILIVADLMILFSLATSLVAIKYQVA